MTWDEIFILLIMVMDLVAIDMLVAKFNLTAGRIVAVLTFFILFPLGLIAGVVALICMNSKGKQRKFSIIAFCKNVLFHAFLLGIILLYLIDMILLKIFPDATFPVVFLSICFSPVVIVFVAKALDCLRDIKRKPKKADVTTENRVNDPFIVNEKKEAAPTVALQKTDEGDSEKIKPDKPIEKASAPIQKAQDDNKVEETMSQAENRVNEPFIVNEKKREANEEQDKLSDQTSTLIIPEGTTEIKAYEFRNRKDIASVVIPKGVAKIGAHAFNGCDNLESVHVRSLEDWFNIEFEVSLANPLYYAGHLYVNGKLLTECTVPQGVTKINPLIFKGNKDFKKLIIPKGVTEIGFCAFERCKNLTDVKIPEGVTKIGGEAFAYCENLETIAIPCSIKEFGKGVFAGCENLTDVKIPKGVTKIDNGTFADCESLKTIVIPDGVKEIGKDAFRRCKSLTSVVIPKGVTRIGSSAFEDCVNLENVVISDGVNEIERFAFRGCRNLTSVAIPKGVTKIGAEVFSGCSSLDSSIVNGAYKNKPGVSPYASPLDDPCYDPYYDPVNPSHPREERITENGERYYARVR